jgi:hypothetical protein
MAAMRTARIASTLVAVAAALSTALMSGPSCRADENRESKPLREDRLADELALVEFNDLLARLSRQAVTDPAAVNALARVLAARYPQRARSWCVSALANYLQGTDDRKETALLALVVELYVACGDDRELLLRCAKHSDCEVADLARVVLAGLKNAADLPFFLEALERVPPSSRWSAAVGVLALGDATTWDRFSSITRAPGWREDDTERGPLKDVIAAAAGSRLLDELQHRDTLREDAERGQLRSGTEPDNSSRSVQSVIELELEGELAKDDSYRRRKLVAWAWSQDRRAVIASISLALTPQTSSGEYDNVRATNAIALGRAGPSSDDLDQALRRICLDSAAPTTLLAQALRALAIHGMPDSNLNRPILVSAMLRQPTPVAQLVAIGLLQRGDRRYAIELRSMSMIGHRHDDGRGLSDDDIAHVALALTAISRSR